MRTPFFFAVGLFLLTGSVVAPAAAQQLNNDGFQRRNGQMHVVRNGQLRPMLRDARLPTGMVVTKDGFVVGRNGERRELREGQGCDLKGNPVAVVAAAGGVALVAPAAAPRGSATDIGRVREVLADLLGSGHSYEEYDEKARERFKKEEEWRREAAKKQEEYERERGKKWKGKWKKGKDWDD